MSEWLNELLRKRDWSSRVVYPHFDFQKVSEWCMSCKIMGILKRVSLERRRRKDSKFLSQSPYRHPRKLFFPSSKSCPWWGLPPSSFIANVWENDVCHHLDFFSSLISSRKDVLIEFRDEWKKLRGLKECVRGWIEDVMDELDLLKELMCWVCVCGKMYALSKLSKRRFRMSRRRDRERDKYCSRENRVEVEA